MTSPAKNNNVVYKQLFHVWGRTSPTCEFMPASEELARKRANPTNPRLKCPVSEPEGSCGPFQRCWQHPGRFISTKIQTVSDPRQRDYNWRPFCAVPFSLQPSCPVLWRQSCQISLSHQLQPKSFFLFFFSFFPFFIPPPPKMSSGSFP